MDRRNDRALQALDASIMASGVAKKASIDGAGKSQQEGRGGHGSGRGRNPRRDGVRPEGGGQPHRQRKGDRRPQGDRPAAPAPTYNPMAGERSGSPEPKPVDQMKRRPRRRRPSNGGKGYGGQKG